MADHYSPRFAARLNAFKIGAADYWPGKNSVTTAIFRERHAFTAGQTIHLKPDPDHIHIFDAATGVRL